ncbi:stage III sporulation protein AH [Lysinibacillus sphaericus]|uniref:SpoIIIAH-like family protein n=1 Tax=Lysinibacillus sphaericus TaxID=1421 RepID=UPI0018CD9DBA|nr:SpoIIIAH-like family protein [Lysinibacillus sphaericus]MBG9452670.1 stage III sporulation protein AH [Lysinibacillus sphaericus]MBG9479862.1 stage III sporulation protein AH [Lysinibacillus sphaericus]MBG9595219.1 stage III sporulation protein AH [Lysinibacillus sphaericus]
MHLQSKSSWLLALLTLVAVISVYSLTNSPKQSKEETTFREDADQKETLQNVIKEVSSPSPLFEEKRLQVSNERNQLRQKLTQQITSDQYFVEDKNKASIEIDTLNNEESTETILEMQIKTLGYPDALVQIEGEKVSVTVMAKELSKYQANEIIYMVKKEYEEANVQVKFGANNY